MDPGGSSAFNAPAFEDFYGPLQVGGRIRRERGYASNDQYVVQVAQDATSTPDSGRLYPHINPQNPAVASPAHPSNPTPMDPPFTTKYHFPPHHDDTSYYYAAYYNSPAWPPDGGARFNDGSSPSSLALSSPPASSPPSAAGRDRPHECGQCPPGEKRFASRRDLQRHENTSHKSDETPMYVCWCGGRGNTTSRKDNHIRHVRSCNMQPAPYYHCICGLLNAGKEVHLTHVQNCGRTRTHHHRMNQGAGASR